MKSTVLTTENDTGSPDTPLIRLSFQDAKKAQACIGRLIRLRYKKKISDFDYKSILYGMNQWLAYEKHNKELDIEKRIEALEAMTK